MLIMGKTRCGVYGNSSQFLNKSKTILTVHFKRVCKIQKIECDNTI